METKRTDMSNISQMVSSYLDSQGVTTISLIKKLGLPKTTFYRRLKKNNWSHKEVETLRIHNVIK